MPLPGIAWMLVFAAVWGLSAFLAWKEGALTDLGDVESLRLYAGIETPQAPAGTYALLFPLVFGPGAAFFLLGVPWLTRQASRPVVLFAAAWGIPAWILVELIPDKLPQFVLPAVPAVAILTAVVVDEGAAIISSRWRWIVAIGPFLLPGWIAVGVAWLVYHFDGRVPVGGLVPMFLSFAIAAVAWKWLRRGETVAAMVLSIVSGSLVYLGLFGMIFPNLAAIRISERLIETGRDAVTCAHPSFAVAGYPEQSLIFLAGPETLMTTAVGAANFLDGPGCRVAFVDSWLVSSFRQRAEDLGIEVLDRGKVTGLNLGKARVVDIRVYAVKEATE